MANDDYLLKGSLRRVQVVRGNTEAEVEETRKLIDSDDKQDASDKTAEKLPITQEKETETAEKPPAVDDEKDDGGAQGGKFVIQIDEEASNWIQEVRETGEGLAGGPDDGVIAKPSGVTSERFATLPEESEPEKDEPPKSLDDFRAEGRKILDGDADDEFETEVQRTMGALSRLMARVEKSIFRRK